jgi:thioredoxin:protein disulfide reductase
MNSTLSTTLLGIVISFPLVGMQYCPTEPASWSVNLTTLIQTSNSLGFQLSLVFLLGLLMSLTPCIYPMIPITVGILQAQGSKSLFANFIAALAYTFGLATTFALLGLLAAFSGQVFGSLLTNPYVIVPLVLLLAYLGGSMLGLYDMYIPRWMNTSATKTVNRGSIISIFFFGLVSGSVASPCLSPGLIFLLSIVTALANKLLGFLFLFVFGIGLSIPLLFIGSFSGSLALLPRAGVWMIEVKRILGLLMIATCFYFLNSIIPYSLFLWIVSTTLVLLGLWYIYITTKGEGYFWIMLKSCIGLALIIAGVLTSSRAYHSLYKAQDLPSCWMTSYHKSLMLSRKQQKLLLIDVGAPCCSICHAIDAKLFTNVQVLKILKQLVMLKIDGSDATNSSSVEVLNTYNVIGFPTILIIDPRSNTILKRWTGELYGRSVDEFISEIQTVVDATG